jgi:hypothetical protein
VYKRELPTRLASVGLGCPLASVRVFDRDPAGFGIVPVVPLGLRLRALDYNSINPQLRSRHLHLVLVISIARIPSPKRRDETNLLVMGVLVFQTG